MILYGPQVDYTNQYLRSPSTSHGTNTAGIGISVPMPAGSIVGIRGSLLKHFVAPRQGQRYSVVHFFKESLRRWPPKKSRTKDYAVPEVEPKTRTEIRAFANTKIDLKESQLTLSEQTKRKRRARNRRRKRAQEIRKMVAYDYIKPKD
jgi:hypothetical protein